MKMVASAPKVGVRGRRRCCKLGKHGVQLRGRVERIEEGGLVERRGGWGDAQLNTLAEQRRLAEVLQPEGRRVGTDLPCDLCKIDDAGIVALQPQFSCVDP